MVHFLKLCIYSFPANTLKTYTQPALDHIYYLPTELLTFVVICKRK